VGNEGLKLDEEETCASGAEGLEQVRASLGLRSLAQVYGALTFLGTPLTGLFAHAPRLPEDFATLYRGGYRGALISTSVRRGWVSIAVDRLLRRAASSGHM
jgi:hypothetical protein